jgi:hypothetical protein
MLIRERAATGTIRQGLVMAGLLFATVMVLAACGDDPVSTSNVEQALKLMTGTAQPGCVKDMDYRDGNATFRCGVYACWTTAHAHNDGFDQRTIEGAAYYDCDNRYAPQRMGIHTTGHGKGALSTPTSA